MDGPTSRRGAGTRGPLLTFFALVSFLGGVALVVAGAVNILHLHDTAGGIFGIFSWLAFVLAGGYMWRLRERPTVESTAEGIVFHADVDPFMRLLAGRRTITFRWEDIGVVDVRPTRVGVTLRLELDRGSEQGERVIPIAYPSSEAVTALIADMRRRSMGKRPNEPTRWLGVGGSPRPRSG